MGREEKFVTQVMKDIFNFELEKIPESDEKSPDFITTDGDNKILLELKTKVESKEEIKRREHALNNAKIYSKTAQLGRQNTISKRVREAAVQLSSQKEKANANLCFVILHATGSAENEHIEQFKSSLYGSCQIISFGSPIPIKLCYYYENSDFYNNKNIIDGALIIGERAAIFCINDLSSNYGRVKSSRFAAAFDGGIIDPRAREAEGKAFIVDGDIDRKDKFAVDSYLCKKYSLPRVIDFNFIQHSLTSKISDEYPS